MFVCFFNNWYQPWYELVLDPVQNFCVANFPDKLVSSLSSNMSPLIFNYPLQDLKHRHTFLSYSAVTATWFTSHFQPVYTFQFYHAIRTTDDGSDASQCFLRAHQHPLLECFIQQLIFEASSRIRRGIVSSKQISQHFSSLFQIFLSLSLHSSLWEIREIPFSSGEQFIVFNNLYSFYHSLYAQNALTSLFPHTRFGLLSLHIKYNYLILNDNIRINHYFCHNVATIFSQIIRLGNSKNYREVALLTISKGPWYYY